IRRIRSARSGLSFSTSEIARAIARGSPATRRSTSEELAGNDKALDFARAFADRRQLDVAEVLLGRIVFHEAVAAVNLHAVVGGLHGDFARVQLGHRGLERGPLLTIFQVRGAVGQEPRGL